MNLVPFILNEMNQPAIAKLAEQVRTERRIDHSRRSEWDVAPASGPVLSLSSVSSILEFSPADAIVTVGAGIRLSELQSELAASGHRLPIDGFADWTLAELVAFNLPHVREGTHGGWTDWILGMTVILGDGLVAKCGAKVVKNVAGYDVQKLFLGARGTLGIVVELTLRICPLSSVAPLTDPWSDDVDFIQRTQLADFDALVSTLGSRIVNQDVKTATVWAKAVKEPTRFPHDWILRPGSIELRSPEIEFMRRAKSLFDPEGKMNPGAMGIF